ncbi:hypothetical protein DH2020_012305 [Rehmannia glutinosa]|uniref:E3 ubiquitin-protein ligase RMA n=1 Tax=Rehmannia glutinosa TaxID=99300 RepID=A0ABR0X0F2_REHGL
MSEAEAHEVGDFECNICFDIAQEPVITLCGHLHCWPCLYKWLQFHSQSHECPVCKALIDEEKLIPLYGRGKTPTDPRSKPVEGVVEIPGRPAGQRPQTAPPIEASNFANAVFGNNFDNIGMFAGFGGVLFPVLGVQFHGFSYGSGYGGLSGHDYGYIGSFSEGGLNRQTSQGNGENLKRIIFYILVFVFFAILTM